MPKRSDFNTADAESEAAYAERTLWLIDDGDRACDEALILEAKAFFVAMQSQPGRKLYLWRAAQPIPCRGRLCSEMIAVDGYFTSIFLQLEKALENAHCLKCRKFTWPKGVKR